MNWQELQQRITQGEDLHTEFKEWPLRPQDIAAAFVAFANTNGGQLILGVRDRDRVLVGVPSPDDALQQLDNIAYNNCEPPLTIISETFTAPDGQTLLVVNVPKGDLRPYRTSSGIYYVRVASGRRQASRQELLRLFQSGESLYYDETVVPRATLADLDKNAIQNFFAETQGAAWESVGLTYERVLVNLKIAQNGSGTLQPTLAGALFFAQRPQFFVPYAYLSALRIPGTSLANDPADQKKIEGTIPDILEDSLRFLYIHLPVPHRIQGLEPEARPEFPAVALRELLINAFAHRDYTIQGPIRVLIFDDRLEIRSPGRLPNSVTLESLRYGVHVLRNPVIYNFFLRLGYVTDAGSGVLRTMARVREATGHEPTWEIEGNEVVVRLVRPRDVY